MYIKRILVLAVFILLSVNILPAENVIKIYSEARKGGGFDLYGDNTDLIPYHVELSFTKLENLSSNQKIPYTFVLPSRSDKNYILSLTPPNNDRYSFNFIFYYYKGDPWTVHHNDFYHYLFPFAHGAKYRIDQGYNGASTHKGNSAYSLDFGLDIGTPVHAAREGLVCGVKEDSNIGGPEEKFAEYGNYIEIYHSDGSFATYVHLKQNGALVEPGDMVKAGDLIGYSGNTGLSSGPHLHFAVSIPVLKGTKTIPVQFLNYDLQPVSPQQGLYYYATHPGKPAFKVELAQAISNSDYDNYSETIDQTDKIEFRTETIDTKVLIFARNGFTSDKKLTINFTLTNMQPSKKLPYDTRLPALKEVFLFYLEIKDYTKYWKYKYNYKYGNID